MLIFISIQILYIVAEDSVLLIKEVSFIFIIANISANSVNFKIFRLIFYKIFWSWKKKNCIFNLFYLYRSSWLGCSNKILQNEGMIISPGYNAVPYPNSQRCIYTIELPDSKSDQPLAFIVNSFDVAEDDRLLVMIN